MLCILLGFGNNIKIWSYEKEERDIINNERKCKFLPEVVLPDNIYCSLDYKEVIDGSDYIIHVTPSKFTRSTVKQYKEFVTNQPIIICSKGFEMGTLKTLDEVLEEELPNTKIAVLSGPSHAEEVSRSIPTAMVVASKNKKLSEEIQDIFMSPEMRIYISDDVKGVELGGALKNIIAFCAGVAAGLGLGDNSYAALITRGLTELSRLSKKLGAKPNTLYGLSGLGDLIVTCLSEHSRNRKAGMLIAKGLSLDEVKKEVGMTIESIDNIDVAYELANLNDIEMPIVNAVYDILYNGLNPKDAVNILMTRDKKYE